MFLFFLLLANLKRIFVVSTKFAFCSSILNILKCVVVSIFSVLNKIKFVAVVANLKRVVVVVLTKNAFIFLFLIT